MCMYRGTSCAEQLPQRGAGIWQQDVVVCHWAASQPRGYGTACGVAGGYKCTPRSGWTGSSGRWCQRCGGRVAAAGASAGAAAAAGASSQTCAHNGTPPLLTHAGAQASREQQTVWRIATWVREALYSLSNTQRWPVTYCFFQAATSQKQQKQRFEEFKPEDSGASLTRRARRRRPAAGRARWRG